MTVPHPQPTGGIPSSSGNRNAVSIGSGSNLSSSNGRAAVDFLGGAIVAPFLFGLKNLRGRRQMGIRLQAKTFLEEGGLPLQGRG